MNDKKRTGYPSKRIFYTKIHGHPVGAWHWRRNATRGIVCRIGPFGHIQIQTYRMKFIGHHYRDGRRGRHGIEIHTWGVKGRRRKKGVGFYFIL